MLLAYHVRRFLKKKKKEKAKKQAAKQKKSRNRVYVPLAKKSVKKEEENAGPGDRSPKSPGRV